MAPSCLPHLEAVIQIVRYLKVHPGCGLLYKSNGHLKVEAFTNPNWVGSPSFRRFTTSYCTFLGGNLINLITWKSKKQTFVSRSSAKVE